MWAKHCRKVEKVWTFTVPYNIVYNLTSVPNPRHFETDPDPWIRTLDSDPDPALFV
jgi:hypothetical protein